MTFSRSDLLGQTNPNDGTFGGTGTAAWTTSNITTLNNSLLVVVVSAHQNLGTSAHSASLTATWNSLPLARQINKDSSAADPYSYGIAIFTLQITTGATAPLVIDDGTFDIGQYNVTAHCYTGYDTVTPVGLAVGSKVLAADGADSVTLAQAPAATSEVVGGRAGGDATAGTIGASPGANHVELYDLSNTDQGGMQVQVQTIGTASATFAWADVQTGTATISEVVGAAIEIRAAPPGYTGTGFLRTEDGSAILEESADYLVLEAGTAGSYTGAGTLLTEAGDQILQESGSQLLLEATPLTALTQEQGRYVLTEAGDHLLLESAGGGTPATANAVAATVTVTANNPAGSGTATASAVSATVTASATNPVASPLIQANAVAASVTASATNPVASGGAKASAVAATVTVTATNPVASPYFLYDDFSGSSIDSTIWTVYNRLGDQANSEVDAVIPANVRVSSGTLKIDSKFEDVVAGDTTTGAPNPRTVHYTSGQIAQTRPAFLYGTVEVRAKICGGTGTWPCIWMLGTNWQASQPFTADDPAGQIGWPTGGWWEVDIAEFINGHRTLQNCALHFVTANRGASGEKTIPFDATTRFMVYRLEWTATSMKWKIDAEDGNGFVTLLSMTGVPGTDIPNTAAFLIIHTAIGGFGGTPDSATFPVSTEVDWARITLDPQTGYPPGAVVTATASNPVATGTGRASAVAATVTATASNPAASGTANASAVAAVVTATATDPVAHGAGTASPPAALVTVTANNPAAGGTAQANAVAASVTVTASNPAGSGTALASPVAALVAVTAADPTVTGTATASAVNALVAVTATNPVAQTAGDGLAHPVAASVTVTATDPTFTVSSTATAVMALVAVTATDPAVSGTGTASAVFALVAVTASNPVASGQGNAQANVVAALVVVTATDPGVSGAGTATPGFAAITAGATNPTVNLTATATVLAALVIVTATNPGTSGGASTFFFGVRRTVRRDPIRRSIQIDPTRRSKKVP
jgi:beta-glucanase (GH16 family)